MSSRKPHADDIAVGKRLREYRNLRGLSQEKLAAKVGVTFQQIQKYENGTNRIGPARMIALSRALEIAPAALLGGEDDAVVRQVPEFCPQTMAIAREIEALSKSQRTTIANMVRMATAAGAATARCPSTLEMFPEECEA